MLEVQLAVKQLLVTKLCCPLSANEVFTRVIYCMNHNDSFTCAQKLGLENRMNMNGLLILVNVSFC